MDQNRDKKSQEILEEIFGRRIEEVFGGGQEGLVLSKGLTK